MESAVIIYHKNALNYYQHKWLIKCLDTIENQTYKNYDVFEVSYGDGPNECSIVKYFKKIKNNKLYYFHKILPDHSYAMNFLLNKVFHNDTVYKYCFNINIDDFYDVSRFERQIKIIQKLNYDIDINENDTKIKKIDYLAYNFKKNKPIQEQIKEEQRYIKNEFLKNHNVIANPCVCYTRRFWKLMGPYKNIVPREDYMLFKKAAISNNINIHISKKFLLYYRIHDIQTTSAERKGEKVNIKEDLS
jgi:hypothetical protein